MSVADFTSQLASHELLFAFAVGLLSAVHCVSMCGGIMGALAFGLPPETRSNWAKFVPFVVTYNLGRILTYALAGALIAGIGSAVVTNGTAHTALRWFAASLMIGIGLYLAGWFPQMMQIEKLGLPIWRRLQPFARRLLPVRHWYQAGAYGVIWGWLPCGLVYSMLFTAAAQLSALHGALYMAAFGFGTLIPVVSAGLLTGRMGHFQHIGYIRQAGGVFIIALALMTLLFPGIGMPDSASTICSDSPRALHEHDH